MDAVRIYPLQCRQLRNRCISEYLQSFSLRFALFYKNCIVAFQICQDKQMIDVRIIPYIAFFIGVIISPLFCGNTILSHIEQIGFAGIFISDLCGS